MRYLASAVLVLSLAGCNAESNAAPGAATAMPQIVGNGAPPDQGAMPSGNPMLEQLGEIGGAAEAGIALCGLDADVADAKRQQREQFIRMGGTPEQFEAAYQAGFDRARQEYDAASPAERQRMCDGLRDMQAGQPVGDW